MNIIRITCTLILAIGLLVPVAVPAQAQSLGDTSCTCWCGAPGEGATSSPVSDTQLCAPKCDDQNKQYLGCFQDPEMSPQFNQKCFTDDDAGRKQCTESKGKLDDKQPADCMPGSRYCFPDPTLEEHQLKLNVAIGSTTTVVNVSQYINVFYRWLLGAALLFSIVMIMIGGLQYTIGSGAGGTQKAKERIKNAVIGVILLLSVYALIYTINPFLLKLQTPQLPMVRPISLSETDRCGYLLGKYGPKDPYTLGNGAPFDSPHASTASGDEAGKPWDVSYKGAPKCGNSGDVLRDWEGKSVGAGTQCFFDYCKDFGDRCVGLGPNAQCRSCGEIVAENEFGIEPSSATCRQFGEPDLPRFVVKNGKSVQELGKRIFCGYTKDGDFSTGAQAIKAGEEGSCVQVTIDCNAIDECKDYADASAANGFYQGSLKEADTESGFAISCGGTCGDFSFMDVCRNDPCGVSDTGCSFYDSLDSCGETLWSPS